MKFRPRPVVDAVDRLAEKLAILRPALARAPDDPSLLERLGDLEAAINVTGVCLGLERRSILIRTPRLGANK